MRVCILQPLIPRYRVPVFTELARTEGIDLEVWADLLTAQGSLKGISSSESFVVRHAFHRRFGGLHLQPSALSAVRGRFDVVVLNDNVRQPGLWAAIGLRRTPLVVWGHGFGTTHPRLGDALRSVVVRSADAALFYSDRGRDLFVARGVNPSKLFVAPNAIDQGPILAAKGHWNETRLRQFMHEQGLADRRLMLYLSRLEGEKRPELAIDALAVLRAKHPDLALVFIGDGSERARLETIVHERGLTDCVRFLGAIHDEDQIAPWALSADLLIHPGALGLTVLHAFGYGLPVVTTDNKQIQMPEADYLLHGINGLEYREGHLDDLIACCDRLLSDDSARRAMSDAALVTVHGLNGRNITTMVAGMVSALKFAAAS